jgi:hypothetical protein
MTDAALTTLMYAISGLAFLATELFAFAIVVTRKHR